MAEGGSRPASPGVGVRELVELVSAVIAPATALAALLYYFGYVREQAIFRYFGVDPAIFDFSTQDYLVRSAGIAFRPLAVLLSAGIAAVFGHLLLQRWLMRIPVTSRAARAVVRGTPATAAGLIAIGVDGLGILGPSDLSPLFAAVALAAGLALAEYSVFLAEQARWRRRSRRARRRGRPPTAFAAGLALPRRLLLAGAFLLAVFWCFAIYAQDVGTSFARGTAATVADLPETVVLSKQRLQIGSEFGVASSPLAADNAAYAFRYTGLHLLQYRNQRWMLLPTGWTVDNGAPVIVLYDDPETVRVDYRR